MLAEKDLTLEIHEGVKEFLLNAGYDPTFGARPIKRTIQKHVVNPLSAELLMNRFQGGDTIVVVYPGAGKLEFNKK